MKTQNTSIRNGQPPISQVLAYRVMFGNGGGAIPQCHQLDAITSPLAGLLLLALLPGLLDKALYICEVLGGLRYIAPHPTTPRLIPHVAITTAHSTEERRVGKERVK